MSNAYNQLLDATIQHLEDLKSRGVRNVAVSPETLRALSQPVKTVSAPAQIPKPMSAPKVSTAIPASTTKSAELPLASPGEAAPALAPFDPKEKAAAFAALRERALAA